MDGLNIARYRLKSAFIYTGNPRNDPVCVTTSVAQESSVKNISLLDLEDLDHLLNVVAPVVEKQFHVPRSNGNSFVRHIKTGKSDIIQATSEHWNVIWELDQ